MKDLLRNRQFALIWAGQSVSGVGDWIRRMALTFWTYQVSGHSPTATAAMVVATFGPALFGSVAGAFVNRWSHRRVMLWASVISAAASAALAMAVTGRSLWLVLIIAFLGSLSEEFYYPARQAMVPTVVPQDRLVGANSLSQITANLALTLGPVIGTAVYYGVGPQWALGLDAVSFAVVAAAVAMADLPANQPAGGEGLKELASEMRDGFVHFWEARPARYAGLAFALAMFGFGADMTCEIFLITRNLGLPESLFSVSIAVYGVAMVGTSFAALAFSKRISQAWPLVVSGLGLVGLFILGLGLSPNFAWLLFWDVLGGIGNSALSIGVNTQVQTVVGKDFLTRVYGALSALWTVAYLTGSGFGGLLAKMTDVRWVFIGSGVIMLGACLLGFWEFRRKAGPGQASVDSLPNVDCLPNVD